MKETKKAFVLMPFREPYNSYYTEIYKPALEDASYMVSRADDLFTPRPIMLDIQQSICEANLILCEMSERNPNVFYELGLAHAVGKPAILVARKEDDIPFDLRHIRAVVYDFSFPGWEDKLRRSIFNAAKTVDEKSDVWPPPLTASNREHPEQLLHNLMRDLQGLLSQEQERRSSMITVMLHQGTNKIELPLELSRADLSRAEIIGRIGMLPIKNKGMRFSLNYVNSPEFLKQINSIKAGHSADPVLTILCTEEEFTQFDL